MLEAEVHALTDDPLIMRDRRADQLGRELERRVVAEARGKPLLGEFHAVPFHAREADLERVAIWADGAHHDRGPRRLRRRWHRLRREVEGDAEDVGVLDVEKTVVIEVIRLPA